MAQFFFRTGALIVRPVHPRIPRWNVTVQWPKRAFVFDEIDDPFYARTGNDDYAIFISQNQVAGVNDHATADDRRVDPPWTFRSVGAGNGAVAENGAPFAFADHFRRQDISVSHDAGRTRFLKAIGYAGPKTSSTGVSHSIDHHNIADV